MKELEMGVLNGSVSGVPLPFQSFFGFYAVFGSDRIGLPRGSALRLRLGSADAAQGPAVAGAFVFINSVCVCVCVCATFEFQFCE